MRTIFKSKSLLTMLLLMQFTCIHIQAQTNELTDLEQRIQNLENNNLLLNRLRVTGHIQSQFSWGEKDANFRIGAPNKNPEKSFSRVGIREGQLNLFVEEGIVLTHFQVDLTERGIGVRNIFLQLSDPIWGTNALRTGLFMIPFGYDVRYSPVVRGSPERSAIVQDLFPGERDLGAMFILQAPQTSPLNIFRLDAGLFAGNRRNVAVDSRMSFIGRLSAQKNVGNVTLGGGLSYYHGGVFQGTENVYTMVGSGFELNSNTGNIGRYAKREYFGVDAQFGLSTAWGMTRIKTEYIFGQQPGAENSSRSPNASLQPDYDTFIRPMQGGYIMLTQDLGRLPLTAVLKYDWYNPNTAVSGNDVGLNGTNRTDLLRTAYGFGLIWNIIPNVRMKAYYEIVRMEASSNINHNFKGDSFTLRLQYRF